MTDILRGAAQVSITTGSQQKFVSIPLETISWVGKFVR